MNHSQNSKGTETISIQSASTVKSTSTVESASTVEPASTVQLASTVTSASTVEPAANVKLLSDTTGNLDSDVPSAELIDPDGELDDDGDESDGWNSDQEPIRPDQRARGGIKAPVSGGVRSATNVKGGGTKR
ncbi:hypothetical protein BT96DRAFT_928892 [Gymnopus androsaceus JB14]|uniref:Uncharacterized protein n=1 Tax=Gymnopus androsaceus JB14 TaxID=1447944 RepID=A0A6A4GIE4_9AGAR|nr:hypothetical protein BT96DRAFT_928892 [Gymnopus androsaceus JB14]